MTTRLTVQQRIEQSREAIAFLSNPAFGLDSSPLRARLIADHERRLASDARLVIPAMKEARS
ncbi:hypothetical protein [Asaia krungthepensis]|uniref:Uncharacterized protein n=1 Tax=Asaia krungthepensis NRIC 0535 TaxID=1307925 RepID=A0ABQ0Q346_9PROT|nr:hypothetical protein [Asaia krungthepensis]GBQ89111.1 hypothetical protein AA0535_1714 [Asaia krungthepensis NRIC 0535]